MTPPERDAWFGCLLWREPLNSSGYGTRWENGRPRMAHIAAWEDEHGPVPKGMVVDHCCRRRNCVALAHLEVVTQSENLRRRAWGYRAQRRTCAHGHDLQQHGRRTPEAGIVCRLCSGVWQPESERAV